MEPVRVACVRYLNTVPLIEGLDKLEGVELIPAVPSHIIDLVASRQADIGLVSLIDAARSTVPLSLVPAGMIGCDGPTLTVRLFSSVPIDSIRRVHADTDSHSSTALCGVVLDLLHGLRPAFVDFDARERMTRGESDSGSLDEAWPETLLLIGDKVVTDSPPAIRYPHQLDLGDAWHDLTGLPFVYAMWMCRREDVGTPRLDTIESLLERQLRHNLTRMDWIVTVRAPEHRWPLDLARRYLGDNLRFEVGQREREAVERFLAEAERLGLIESNGVHWRHNSVPA